MKDSRAFLLTVVMLSLVGGAVIWTASPPAVTIAATDQIERGKSTFQAICARCHGDQGQGDKCPRLIGSPNGLSGYGTAKGLFDFVSTQMPFDNPGTLKEQDYWDVLAFILDANGLLPPDAVLGPDDASDISVVK